LTVYLDTSVVVPLFIDDDHAPRVRAWSRLEPTVALSAWTLAEFSSAISMQVRMKHLRETERADTEVAFDAWASRGWLVDFDVAQIVQARRLLRRHIRLRAPDALHLAIAQSHSLDLATLDTDMKEAADAEGMRVIEL
jgi:hypothetical protein